MIRNSVVLLLLIMEIGLAQLSISNLMEYQLGNLPHNQPENMSTLYDQLKISYQYKNLSASIQAEQFQSSFNEREYNKITRRSLLYQTGNWEVVLGNFYQIFGRGLLLRNYNIPGTVLEDVIYRSRYGFFKDIDGISFQYYGSWLNLKVLRGKPLRNDFPPIIEEDRRRQDLIEGAEAIFKIPGGLKLGGSYIRNNDEDLTDEYGALSVDIRLPANIQVYGEYAQKMEAGNPDFNLSNQSIHALYMSVNGSIGRFGWSGEYKDYNDFNLPFNDPPPLIKEHAYTVLNRSTHVLNARNETGWQFESFYTFNGGHTVTVNTTTAENKFAQLSYVFREYFIEISLLPNINSSVKLFFDSSKEPFLREMDRLAGGVYWEQLWFKGWGTTIDLQYQQFERELMPVQNVENYFAALSVSESPNFSAGIIWERSTDPQLTDNPTTPQLETSVRNWWGLTLAYQINRNHSFNMFYGQRRGGPACTSGICYEVLDFEGFEFRLSSTF